MRCAPSGLGSSAPTTAPWGDSCYPHSAGEGTPARAQPRGRALAGEGPPRPGAPRAPRAPAAALPPAHPARKSSAMAVLPPRPLSPSAARCPAGRRREPPAGWAEARCGRRLRAQSSGHTGGARGGAAAPRASPRPAEAPGWPAREPSSLPGRRPWSLTSGRAPRPWAGRWARAGCRAQPMGGRGADNAPGPARRRRASLAGRARGGRGAGDVGGGRAGEAPGRRRQRVCFARPPARRSAQQRLRGFAEAGPCDPAREPTPRPGPAWPGILRLCDACAPGGTGGGVRARSGLDRGTWDLGSGSRLRRRTSAFSPV